MTAQSSFNNLANPDKHVLVKAVPVLDNNGDQVYDENNKPVCRLALVPIGVINGGGSAVDLSDYALKTDLSGLVSSSTLETELAKKLNLSGGTLTGALNGTSITLTGLLTALTVVESVVAANTGAIDCNTGSFFTVTPSANITVALSNMKAGQVIGIKVTNGGAHTITWPSAWLWSGGTAPELQESGVDLITVFYDGSNYLANIAPQFATV